MRKKKSFQTKKIFTMQKIKDANQNYFTNATKQFSFSFTQVYTAP